MPSREWNFFPPFIFPGTYNLHSFETRIHTYLQLRATHSLKFLSLFTIQGSSPDFRVCTFMMNLFLYQCHYKKKNLYIFLITSNSGMMQVIRLRVKGLKKLFFYHEVSTIPASTFSCRFNLFLFNWKVFILPRVAEMLIHKEKSMWLSST